MPLLVRKKHKILEACALSNPIRKYLKTGESIKVTTLSFTIQITHFMYMGTTSCVVLEDFGPKTISNIIMVLVGFVLIESLPYLTISQ